MKTYIIIGIFLLSLNNVWGDAKPDSSSFASLLFGKSFYTPNLSSVRNRVERSGYGKLKGNSNLYFSFHFGKILKGDTPTGSMISVCRYKAKSDNFSISVTNILFNLVGYLSDKDDRITGYIGLGANAFYIERKGLPDTMIRDIEYNDWLYGLNGLFGIAVKIHGSLYAGYEIGYTWGKESTLGGYLYDLSDRTNVFYLGLLLL